MEILIQPPYAREIAHSLSPKLDTRITQKGFISGAVTGCGKALVLYIDIFRSCQNVAQQLSGSWEHQLLIRDSY